MKIRILFVDDEQRILDGLRRMLRPMRKEWETSFASNGKEALEKLAEGEFDVVVSDMRMPGMDGAELLETVMKLYPRTVRIILSGHSDIEMVLKSVGPSHQYLTKPTSPEELQATINSVFALKNMLLDPCLRKLVGGMDHLPSRPQLFSELVNELQRRESSMTRVGEIVAEDAGMAAQVLRLVNSAYFGLRSEVSSVSRAVTYLGLSTVTSLVLSTSVFQSSGDKMLEDAGLSNTWDHCQKTAAFARTICKLEKTSAELQDDAFAAGLLHDTGQLVLASNYPERYRTVVERVIEGNEHICVAEKDEFGADHGAIGAYMLNVWGLPAPIVNATAFHHRPRECAKKSFGPLTAVHVAAYLAETLGENPSAFCGAELDQEYLAESGVLSRFDVWKAGLEEAYGVLAD